MVRVASVPGASRPPTAREVGALAGELVRRACPPKAVAHVRRNTRGSARGSPQQHLAAMAAAR